MWKPLNPRTMHQRPCRSRVDIVAFAAQRMDMPSGKVIGMILVAAQNNQIATAPHSEMGGGFRFFCVDHEPHDEAAALP